MSFWPRLRRRSKKGRKRSTSSSTKTNPYATGDIDRYSQVHGELEAQRAQFAAEKGVSVSLVRFISRSTRGWVYLPPDSPPAQPSPDERLMISTPSETSQGFYLPAPVLPLAPTSRAAARNGSKEGSTGSHGSESSAGNAVVGSDLKGVSRNVGRLVVSRKFKDKAWMQVSKTAAVLFVKVLVFSRALGATTAFAFTFAVVVDTLNRGKATFQRVFSALAAQLLTSLRPYLSLQQSKSSVPLLRGAPAKSVPQASPSAPRQSSASNEMKVSPITEGSHGQDSRSSSFAFPVLTSNYSSDVASARFTNQQQQQQQSQQRKVASLKTGSTGSTPSPAVSPLVESNKLPSTKPCQKLKSKFFKSSPTRSGENSSPSGEESSDGSSSLSSSSGSSHGKSITKKNSLSKRKAIKGGEEMRDEVEQQPSSSLSKPSKVITRSHELSFFRSPNNKRREPTASKEIVASTSSPPSAGVKNLSRSQELKFALKSLGKKKVCRSQEFSSTLPPSVQDLALPRSTVEGLQALAFPFKEQEQQVQQQGKSSSICSFRPSAAPKRKNSLTKTSSGESIDEKMNGKAVEVGGATSKGGKATTASSSSSSCVLLKSSQMISAAAAELKPNLRRVKTGVSAPSSTTEQHGSDLRKVRTAVTRSPPPSQNGELGRSLVLSPEILGSLLLLAVLGFLLLGRVHAIFATACFCLVLSQFQRFFATNLTSRDKEILKRGSGTTRLHQTMSVPPGHGSGSYGNPAQDKTGLQSSEYRKRVLIEGLLDRGNRRGAIA